MIRGARHPTSLRRGFQVTRKLAALVLGGALVLAVAGAGTQTLAASPARPLAQIQVRPTVGPPGQSVQVMGAGYLAHGCPITLSFEDADGRVSSLGSLPAQPRFRTTVVIPGTAPAGSGSILASQYGDSITMRCVVLLVEASAPFTVTP
jgi:hypothetical protein